jgi:hypothetical protein
MPLRRMQHYPIFFEHHESRAGESEAVLNKEDTPFSIILPVRQQFFRAPFVHSDDAVGRKVWKRLDVFFADLGIKKSSLVQCE